jgi:hypothetical protein
MEKYPNGTKPKIHVSFRLTRSGLVDVDKAEAAIEETVQVEVCEKVKKSKKNDTNTSDESGDKNATVAEAEDEETEASKKNETETDSESEKEGDDKKKDDETDSKDKKKDKAKKRDDVEKVCGHCVHVDSTQFCARENMKEGRFREGM